VRKRAGKLALCLTACVLAACGGSGEFPRDDITIVIPYNPGGGFDTFVRALARSLENHLPEGIHVVAKNSPGAGGRRGANDVFRARPDGYTIGAFNLPGILIPELQDIPIGYKLSEVSWLVTMGSDPYLYSVKGDSELASIDDVKALGRTVLYGATGPGSTAYIATNIFNEILGIPYEVVTGYKGSSAYVLGLIRGDFDAAVVPMSTARPYVESGDIRPLAIIGAESNDPAIADAAQLGEPKLGEIKVVRMIGGPPGLPEDIRAALETALLAALADDDFKDWLDTTGNEVQPAGSRDTVAAVANMSEFYEDFKQFLD
jgi:tripartite-type tricarboxylate transporter receptor subunit TctC